MKFLKVLDNILSKDECLKLIDYFENQNSHFVDRGIAEYYRVIKDDKEFADKLWNRIKDKIPKEYNGSKIIGLNSYFRFSKYEDGMEFGKHKDGDNQDSNGNRSVYTLNIFLNKEFEGGETIFYDEDDKEIIVAVPEPGRGAIFNTQIVHRGAKVVNGLKYLLRTDIMIGIY
jgi:hypothetical protein